MSYITQLNPTIPVTTPKGSGEAVALIDYGSEHHLIWVVFLDKNGQCWSFQNPNIRGCGNPTMGRTCATIIGKGKYHAGRKAKETRQA